PESWAPLDCALDDLPAYRWVVFTSANGAAMVRARLAARGQGGDALSACRIAAIGPGTAAALEAWGVRAEVVPDGYVAEDLAGHLLGRIGPGDRVLVPRAAEARDVLPRVLAGAGARVDVVAAYRTVPAPEAAELRSAVRERAVDTLTFTSSSTVRHF